MYPPTVNRACQRCSRKKVKCDMRRPNCSLCRRLGVSCTFPLRQKPRRQNHSSPGTSKHKTQRLQTSLSAGEGASPGHGNNGDGCDRLTASLFQVLDSNITSEASQERFTRERTLETIPNTLFDEPTRLRADGLANVHSYDSSSSQGDESSFEFPDLRLLTSSENEDPANFRPSTPDFSSGMDAQTVVVNECNGWGIPNEVAVDLIEHYFSKIQPWLAILHRPLFYNEYMVTIDSEPQCLRPSAELRQDVVFMINGIFALSARFSTHSHFATTLAQQRGRKFFQCAKVIKDSLMAATEEEPSLEFVKGCVLQAYYHITAGELAAGSILTSVCVHFAYDLELDMVDANHINEDRSSREDLRDIDAWVHREDLRRLWWAIWELDTFIATLSRQTFRISKSSEIMVCLPVCDEHWYTRRPLTSSLLDPRLATGWKSLQGCPNQSSRAWCLVAKQIKSLIAIAAGRQHAHISSAVVDEFETSVGCFKLVLPGQFHIQSLYLDNDSFVDGLWIISTHLMILACETLLVRLQSLNPSAISGFDAYQMSTLQIPRVKSYLTQIANVWPSQYIPLTNPMMACGLVVPATLTSVLPEPTPSRLEVSTLLLSHMAKYWTLGQVAIGLLSAIQGGLCLLQPPSLYPKERELVKRFSILLPPSPPTVPDDSFLEPHAGITTSRLAEHQHTTNIEDLNTRDLDSMRWPFDLHDFGGSTTDLSICEGAQQQNSAST